MNIKISLHCCRSCLFLDHLNNIFKKKDISRDGNIGDIPISARFSIANVVDQEINVKYRQEKTQDKKVLAKAAI